MATPRVPDAGDRLDLPCGEEIAVRRLDMGMREFDCECGETHAVVMDVHPPSRFLPDFLVDTLETVVETADEFETFGTPHLLGLVMEELPGDVAVADVSDDGQLGYALVWVTAVDSRTLHEIIVELILELMDHAMSHAEDDEAAAAFEADLLDFDVETFVEQYRTERDVAVEDAPPYGR